MLSLGHTSFFSVTLGNFTPTTYLTLRLSYSRLSPPPHLQTPLLTQGLDLVWLYPVSPSSNPFYLLLPDFQMAMSVPWWPPTTPLCPLHCFPGCRPQTSNISATWELVRSAVSQAPPETYESDPLRLRPRDQCCNKPARWFWCVLASENPDLQNKSTLFTSAQGGAAPVPNPPSHPYVLLLLKCNPCFT